MKTEIDIYRGWEISFDTDAETFTAYSNNYDRELEKKSYASIKKFIDEFINDNTEFTPFWIEKDPTGYGTGREKIKVIGIRKDKVFISEDSKGKKIQISSYNEADYTIVYPENETIISEYDKMITEAKNMEAKARDYIKTNYKKLTLKSYKETISI